jgi:hypothetical protein
MKCGQDVGTKEESEIRGELGQNRAEVRERAHAGAKEKKRKEKREN